LKQKDSLTYFKRGGITLFTDEKLGKRIRKFYPENLEVTSWETVEREFKKLLEEPIDSKEALMVFMEKFSEFYSIIAQISTEKYIKMTCYADKPEYHEDYNKFFSEIQAPSSKYEFLINKKFYDSPYRKELGKEYDHMNKIISRKIEAFCEKNIPLDAKENKLSSKYGEIISKLSTEFLGKERTITQLSVYLKDPDRTVRQQAWEKINGLIAGKRDELEELFDSLMEVRVEKAKNLGFSNYRDYKHFTKERFDYTPEDLYEFHSSVEKAVLPILKELFETKRQKLGIDTLRPWDTAADEDGITLKPYKTNDEFVDNAIKILHKVKPEFGKNLELMKNTGFLDLENRKGKAPGGYNTQLPEYGGSFIFMNAVGIHANVITLLHESGHAMHGFSCKHIPYNVYKRYPSEVAELASMSMELITMDYLDEYYKDRVDIKKAKKEGLMSTLNILPWAMTVDAFQQWIYTTNHTAGQRDAYFAGLMDRFNYGENYSGYEKEKALRWLRQLHIFEVPFYYIEYAMAQLGAIAVFKNYKENGEKAIEQYHNALKLGYSKPIPEIYRTAGIKFDFSYEYIKELVGFIKNEIDKL